MTSSYTSIQPSHFHRFGLRLHNIEWIIIVTVSMKGSGRIVFILRCILFWYFHDIIWPYFRIWQRVWLVNYTIMLGFLIRVFTINLILKYLLGCIESLTEIYKFIDTLGGQVEFMKNYLFIPLSGGCKLDNLDDFIVWKSLRHPKWR